MLYTTILNFFKSIIVCNIFVFFPSLLYSQAFEKGKIKHRVSIAPLKSFYKNDPHLTTKTKAKFGFNASYKAEFFSGKKLNFTAGLDYSYQHFTFKGYYAAPGYTYLFDKTFPYTHDVQVQELQLPIGFKESFVREQSYDYTPYVIGGVAFRYLFKTYTVITNDSTDLTVFDSKQSSVDFESKIPAPKINSLLYLGFGFQRNHRDTGRATFFELTYKYGISRFNYYGNNHSNNLGISNNCLAFTVGFRI
jgi:hypothetical protein